MLRPLTQPNNEIDVYCENLTCENLPTFAGVVMPSLVDIVERNAEDILTANRLIVGDGTNIIKDSLAEVDETGNIGIPLDQGYFINSQPIIYQDTADSSKYKVEVNKVLINEPSNQIINSNTNFSQTVNFVDTSANRVYSVQDAGADCDFVMSSGAQTIAGNKTFSDTVLCNNITSVGADDNITIDANGNGKIRFTTLQNAGIECIGADADNWAMRLSNSTDSVSVVLGTFNNGEDHPSIGGHLSNMSAWSPLWIQDGNIGSNAGSYVVVGASTASQSQASGTNKVFVQGNVAMTNHINIYDAGNGTSYHRLTEVATTGTRVHSLQDSSGTIAHLSDITASTPKWSFGSQAGENAATGTKSIYFGFGDTSFSLMEIFATVETGTTGHLEGRNSSDSSQIFSIDVVGDDTLTYASTTSFTNVSGSKNLIIVDWTRTGGAGACNLFGARLF